MLFKALDFDIDISIQAGTKYLIGHSDYMLGTAVANARCWDRLREYSYLMGQMVDADTAYMASRGLRTLSVRLKQHERSSIEVAHWLAARRKWRRSITRPCPAARATSSTAVTSAAATGCSPSC